MGIYEIRKWRKALIFLLVLAMFSLLALFFSQKKEDEHSRLMIMSETMGRSNLANEAGEGETARTESVTAETSNESAFESSESIITTTNGSVTLLPVYVSGAVKTPSLAYLPEDALWLDAVAAAGGLREDAAATYINFAAPISAHQMIYIPSLAEWEAGQGLPPVYPDSVEQTKTGQALGSEEKESRKISLNHASTEELMLIPGVGEKTAAAILHYREKHGPFINIEDIMKIAGIKEGKFEQMKDYIVP